MMRLKPLAFFRCSSIGRRSSSVSSSNHVLRSRNRFGGMDALLDPFEQQPNYFGRVLLRIEDRKLRVDPMSDVTFVREICFDHVTVAVVPPMRLERLSGLFLQFLHELGELLASDFHGRSFLRRSKYIGKPRT